MTLRNVGELIQDHEPLCVGAQQSVAEAARAMAESKVGAAAVVEGLRLIGVFTERDVMCRVVARGLDPAHTPVAEVMTSRPEVMGSDGSIVEALERMVEGHFRHMPVVDGGRLVGMLSMRDIPLEHRLMRENWRKARHAANGAAATHA